MNRKRPFQHAAIFTLIARFWFSSQRDRLLKSHSPSPKTGKERVLEMPDNLIAFACNAVSKSRFYMQTCSLHCARLRRRWRTLQPVFTNSRTRSTHLSRCY